MTGHTDSTGARRLGIFFRAATLAYVALFCIFTALTLLRVPILDLMDWAVFYVQTGRPGPWGSYLWQAHNEHRIPISRLLVAADIEIFHGSGIAFFIVGVLAYLAMVGVLIREIGATKLPAALRLAMIAAVIFCLTATYLTVLIGVPALSVFLQTALFTILAITLLDAQDENRHPARRAGALVCGMLAPFGVSAGLLVWPVLLWTAWRGRLHPAWLLVIGLVGAAEAIIYTHGIPFSAHEPISMAALLQMVDYGSACWACPGRMRRRWSGSDGWPGCCVWWRAAGC